MCRANRRLLLALAVAMAAVGGWLSGKDGGVAAVFGAIALGLAYEALTPPRPPSKVKNRPRRGLAQRQPTHRGRP